MIGHDLGRLIWRIRIGLWLDDLRRSLAPGLWGGALLLAAGALVRWYWGAPGPIAVLALAAAPPALAFLTVLSRCPTPERAVLAADRRAEANALLLSAWDILAGRTPQPAAAPVVLRQAIRDLPHWEQRIGARRSGPPGPNLWSPVIALLAAAPLLGLTPWEHKSADLPEAAARVTATVEDRSSADAVASLQSLVADLRRAAPTAASRPPAGSESRLTATGAGGGLPAPVDTAPPVGSAGRGQANQPSLSMGRTAGGGRDLAGRESARPEAWSAHGAKQVNAPAEAVALARQGAGEGTAKTGAELFPGEQDRPVSSASTTAAPAALPEHLPATRSDFTPAQRSLIARYFALMQEEGHE